MEWFAIMLLLFFGLSLIVIEIILVPGTTLFGIVGFILTIIGIYFGFRDLGSTAGFFISGIFAVVAASVVYYSFKSRAWRHFALTDTIESKVNDEHKILLHIGDVGKAVSDLRPAGKANFNERIVEVHTLGAFLEAGSVIRVLKLESNKIFVIPSD